MPTRLPIPLFLLEKKPVVVEGKDPLRVAVLAPLKHEGEQRLHYYQNGDYDERDDESVPDGPAHIFNS